MTKSAMLFTFHLEISNFGAIELMPTLGLTLDLSNFAVSFLPITSADN